MNLHKSKHAWCYRWDEVLWMINGIMCNVSMSIITNVSVK